MKERLQTVLSHGGVASRRHAAEVIEAGKVAVDGVVVTERGFRVDPAEHEITVNGRPLSGTEAKFYFLFNKPKDVITTVTDTHGRRKVLDYFSGVKARLFPVGRLDKDTTGILIVTNDGELAHTLSHPSFEVEKEYEALVWAELPSRDIVRLERGVMLEEGKTAPCKIRLMGTGPRGATYRVVLHEGRKRQVRRMFDAVGSRVKELKRVRYAWLTLGKLREGEYRSLTAREVHALKERAK